MEENRREPNPWAGLDGPSEPGVGGVQAKLPQPDKRVDWNDWESRHQQPQEPANHLENVCIILGVASLLLGYYFPFAAWAVGPIAVVFGGLLLFKTPSSKPGLMAVLGGVAGIVTGIQVFLNRIQG